MNSQILYAVWQIAKRKVFKSDAPFGAIPEGVITPGDTLSSFKLESVGAYGTGGGSVTRTVCSRCGRLGGRNASDFGINVTSIPLAAEECADCGVTVEILEGMAELGRAA